MIGDGENDILVEIVAGCYIGLITEDTVCDFGQNISANSLQYVIVEII